MTTKTIAMSLVAIVVLVMLAVPETASSANGDCRAKISLDPTAFGQAIGASASVEKRSQKNGRRQKLTVEVDAIVPDGTVFAVFVNNASLAGTITMVLPLGQQIAIGTLDLSNANGAPLPLGVDPVCSLGAVTVTDVDGNVILNGSF